MRPSESPEPPPAGMPVAPGKAEPPVDSGQGGIEYRRYRAPRHHGEILADPPLAEIPQLVQDNKARLRDPAAKLFGEPAWQARVEARRELVQLARSYTAAYRDVSLPAGSSADDTSLFLTGHQPRLFHPGVWYKNFELARLARRLGATAIHLMVDNDLTGPVAVRVPGGSVTNPRLESIPFDAATDEMPAEERLIRDPACFESFGGRVVASLRDLVPDPLIRDWWATAVEAGRSVRYLGLAIARARHILEGQWGLATLELPLSWACDTASFRRFLAALWGDLPRFFDIYNRSLLEYRQVHRIRSRSHPVPQLEQDETWWETPCWVWTKESPRRQRLFVRRSRGGIELTDRRELRLALPEPDRAQGQGIVEALQDQAAQGIKIRPRALLTTLYARMVLCDLFVHGIGGGKYDQLTDAMVRGFFGIEPPRFLVLSATAELPMVRPKASIDERRQLDWEIRDLRYNPDRYVACTSETQPWIEAKKEWLRSEPPRGARRAQYVGIQRANAALAPHVADMLDERLARRERLDEQLRHDRLLGSREFAFCLYPADTLRTLLLDKRENVYKLVDD